MWIVPLWVSAGAALVTTPPVRRLALATGLVDRPAPNKAHRRVTPCLGGIAIAVAVIAGRLVGSAGTVSAALTGLAAVLAVLGLVDDDRQLGWLLRLTVETGCAVVAVLVGLRIRGTGVPALDVALTIILLVGVTNATNLMDNLDGLAAGVTTVGAIGAGVLAATDGHTATTIDAASLVGACLAFLVFNSRPASIFMGDAGSLFLGFLLTALAIRAGSSLPEPASLVVPLLILALPIIDTVTVVLGRWRHGRSALIGGRDHLSHRLAGTGLGAGPAVVTLIGVEGLLAGLADLEGRQVIPAGAALGVAAGIMATLLAVTLRVRVYRADAVGLPRSVAWGLPAAVVVAAGLAVPSAFGLLRAQRPALAGEVAAEAGVSAARAGHLPVALDDLALARADFARADADLHAPLSSAGLAYPVLSSNLRAARTLAGAGLAITRLAGSLEAATDGLHLLTPEGTLSVQTLARAAPSLRAAAAVVQQSVAAMADLPRHYLLGAVSRAIGRAQVAIAPAQHDLAAAAAAATYLPAILGADGPRTYFVAIQNPAESRAAGGLIGNWATIVADEGAVRVGAFGRLDTLDRGGRRVRTLNAPADYLARYQRFDPAQLWQNVNMSPDWPTVGSVIANLYPQSGGRVVDGVIGIDPAGLGALLGLTGPVHVAGWPVPLDAANVVPITLHDAYVRYPNEARRATFLGNVAHAAFAAFSQLHLTDLTTLMAALAPPLHDEDLEIYSAHPAEEAFLRQLGAAGALPAVRSDSIDLTTQNVAGNKIDYYLHRQLTYQVTLHPGVLSAGTPTAARAEVDLGVALHNAAPATGLPPSIIGPYLPQFRAGEEASYVSIYSPLAFQAATLDGVAFPLSSGPELGRAVYSNFVDIASGRTARLHVAMAGEVHLLAGGWYELNVAHQAVVNPDAVEVTVTLAAGWRVTGVRGGTQVGPSQVRVRFSQQTARSVWVRMAPSGTT